MVNNLQARFGLVFLIFAALLSLLLYLVCASGLGVCLLTHMFSTPILICCGVGYICANDLMSLKKSELEFKIGDFTDKIKEKEREYEWLVERRNKGENVDDLITQNQYDVENLKTNKKKAEDALNILVQKKKSVWGSRLEK